MQRRKNNANPFPSFEGHILTVYFSHIFVDRVKILSPVKSSVTNVFQTIKLDFWKRGEREREKIFEIVFKSLKKKIFQDFFHVMSQRWCFFREIQNYLQNLVFWVEQKEIKGKEHRRLTEKHQTWHKAVKPPTVETKVRQQHWGGGTACWVLV